MNDRAIAFFNRNFGLAVIAPMLLVVLLILSACEPKRVVTSLKPPAERLVCEAAGARPTVAPEYRIDWGKVATVAQARAEHERFVASVRTREGVVAGYILNIEGKLFACSNNMAWLREWHAATAAD